jgi:hypothetical protein
MEKLHKQQEHTHNPILWNLENLHSKVAEDGRTAKPIFLKEVSQ